MILIDSKKTSVLRDVFQASGFFDPSYEEFALMMRNFGRPEEEITPRDYKAFLDVRAIQVLEFQRRQDEKAKSDAKTIL